MRHLTTIDLLLDFLRLTTSLDRRSRLLASHQLIRELPQEVRHHSLLREKPKVENGDTHTACRHCRILFSFNCQSIVKSRSYSGKYGRGWQCISVSDHYILLKILNLNRSFCEFIVPFNNNTVIHHHQNVLFIISKLRFILYALKVIDNKFHKIYSTTISM